MRTDFWVNTAKSIVMLIGGLMLLTLAQSTLASATPFSYDIELQVPSSLRSMLETHLDLYHWRARERMDGAQLKRLVRLAPEQVREFLATEGFFSPHIDAQVEQQSSRWLVKLSVDPGKPVLVGNIDLKITGALGENATAKQEQLEHIRTDWKLNSGTIFRQDDWETAKRNALKTLLLNRYPTASIADSRATVDTQNKQVALQLTLDSGPAFTFGELEVQGLSRYPLSMIERVNPIRPNDPYSQSMLLTLQSRLQDSPYFSNATVSVNLNPAHPTKIPIHVEVQENPSQKLGFGIGVSTDTGVRGTIDYRDIHFLDRLWRLSSAIKLNQKQQSFGGDLQFPQDNNGFNDGISALFERTNIEQVVTEKYVYGVKRTFTSGKIESTVGLNYTIENELVQGILNNQRLSLTPSLGWKLRDVDNLINPTQGYLMSLQTDAASRAVLSDRDFLRGYARMFFFYPLGKRDQLIMRSELGVVIANSRDGIAPSFLFRTGGDQTIRGYNYQSLGVPLGGSIVGGRYLALASGEYIHWLSPQWGAALFIDGGNAADNAQDLTPAYGYGLGIRWKSPIGPLNFDLAYGEKTQRLNLHFSLGFSF